MKLSENFDVREFVPPEIWNVYGAGKSTWFVNPKLVEIAEFYKKFFYTYYKAKFPRLIGVSIIINNWHVGGTKKYSGFRPPEYKEGAKLSQHRFINAFDCEIILVFPDNVRTEVDYKEIHQIIEDNEQEFLCAGVTTLEHVDIAKGWLHTDTRYIPGQTKILIVKPA